MLGEHWWQLGISKSTLAKMTKHVNAKLLLLLLLIALALGGAIRPMQAVHWDAPIYLYQAKRFAESHLVDSYRQHAEAVAGQALGTNPMQQGEAYPESYWRFTRLGHIALLSLSVEFFGSSEAAIQAASIIYSVLFALAVFVAVLAARSFCRLYEGHDATRKAIQQHTITAGFVYALSGSYLYMSGNLVAEIPALFVMSLGAWLIGHAIQRDSVLLAVASGFLACLTYVIKMEAVWFFVSIYLVLWSINPPSYDRSRTGRSLGWAVAAALVGYGCYTALFFPLTSPSVFLAFSDRVTGALPSGPSNITAIWTPFAAVGLLWLGIPLAMIAGLRSPLTRFAWFWLALSLLPLITLYLTGSVQTRMFMPLVLPLILVFGLGMAGFMTKLPSARIQRVVWQCVAGVLVISFMIAHPATYTILRELPGAWRLQYVRQLLWPPAYEVKAYPLGDLHRISVWLYGKNEPIQLIAAKTVSQENLNLVRFFGPTYPANADMALLPDPTNLLPCNVGVATEFEPILYRSGDAKMCCTKAVTTTTYEMHWLTDANKPIDGYSVRMGSLVVRFLCPSNTEQIH